MIVSLFTQTQLVQTNKGYFFSIYRLKACISYAWENMAHQTGQIHVQSLKQNSLQQPLPVSVYLSQR